MPEPPSASSSLLPALRAWVLRRAGKTSRTSAHLKHAYNSAVDMWALGVTLHMLLVRPLPSSTPHLPLIYATPRHATRLLRYALARRRCAANTHPLRWASGRGFTRTWRSARV